MLYQCSNCGYSSEKMFCITKHLTRKNLCKTNKIIFNPDKNYKSIIFNNGKYYKITVNKSQSELLHKTCIYCYKHYSSKYKCTAHTKNCKIRKAIYKIINLQNDVIINPNFDKKPNNYKCNYCDIKLHESYTKHLHKCIVKNNINVVNKIKNLLNKTNFIQDNKILNDSNIWTKIGRAHV